MDYDHYKTESLKKMRDAAWDKYQKEVTKSTGKAWEIVKRQYEAISEELRRRGDK